MRILLGRACRLNWPKGPCWVGSRGTAAASRQARQATSTPRDTRSPRGSLTCCQMSIRVLANAAKVRIVSTGGADVRAAGLGTHSSGARRNAGVRAPLGRADPDRDQTHDEEGGAARPHSSSPRRGVPPAASISPTPRALPSPRARAGLPYRLGLDAAAQRLRSNSSSPREC